MFPKESAYCLDACEDSTPCQENSLILLQLFHEGRVWFGDSPSLFYIVKGSVQCPAVLFHSIGDHCGGRAAHTHLTVNKTLSTSFPKRHTGLWYYKIDTDKSKRT